MALSRRPRASIAFIKAGIIAICSIAILLFIVLRRFGDVLLTLIPLLVAALVTLEICGLTGLQINYANIIALPALRRVQDLLRDCMARRRIELFAV